LFDPKEHCGIIEGLFDLPNNLIWCDRETLFKFPMKFEPDNSGSSSLIGICNDEELNETSCKNSFFIYDNDCSFRTIPLRTAIINSKMYFEFYGISVRCFEVLGEILDCYDPLIGNNSARIHLEQLYEFSTRFIQALVSIHPDDYFALAHDWCNAVKTYYEPEPDSYISRRTGRIIWWWDGEIDHSHYNPEYFNECLFNLYEMLLFLGEGETIYFVVEY
jgi:hypothetical protein